MSVHYPGWCMPPFMCQCWGLPRELAQCISPMVGQVSQCCAAPIDEACMSVCCAILLSNGLVGSTSGQAQLSNPRGRACRPNGKGTGKEWVSEYWMTLYLSYLYCPVLGQCFSRRLIQTCMVTGCTATQHGSAHLATSARAGLSGSCGQDL